MTTVPARGTVPARETPFMRRALLALGSRADVRLFRNNVGLGFIGTIARRLPAGCIVLGSARPIKFGLHTGSGDLIGWKTVTITPDMVGKRVAVFLSVETKSATGTAKPEQVNWRDHVRAAGGIAEIIRDGEPLPEVLIRDIDKG